MSHSVLIVDDERAVHSLLTVWLADDPRFTLVGSAYCAMDAVALFDACGPQLVITDFSMPGMHGGELSRVLRRRDPDVVVVLYTAEPERVGMLEHAADAVVAKSTPPDALLNTLHALCQARTDPV